MQTSFSSECIDIECECIDMSAMSALISTAVDSGSGSAVSALISTALKIALIWKELYSVLKYHTLEST